MYHRMDNKHLSILLREILLQMFYNYKDNYGVDIDDTQMIREVRILERKIKHYCAVKMRIETR